jgi:hypothetical protein
MHATNRTHSSRWQHVVLCCVVLHERNERKQQRAMPTVALAVHKQ